MLQIRSTNTAFQPHKEAGRCTYGSSGCLLPKALGQSRGGSLSSLLLRFSSISKQLLVSDLDLREAIEAATITKKRHAHAPTLLQHFKSSPHPSRLFRCIAVHSVASHE
jgi:hypothetical protein